MPRVENIDVPPEYLELWEKSCVINESFAGTKVDKKDVVYRKRNFKNLIPYSNVGGMGTMWWALTTEQRGAWYDAGYWSNQSGWDLYAQDTSYRISNGLVGVATPSEYHQFKIGEIKVEAPAIQIKIKQHYTNDFNEGTYWALNVKTDLVSIGAGSYARFRAFIHTGYWNDDIDDWDDYTQDIDLTEFTDWEYIDDYVDTTYTYGCYIDIIIEIYNMRGSVYIDGMELWLYSENIFRDLQCNEIENNWVGEIVPTGASFQSIYPPDNI